MKTARITALIMAMAVLLSACQPTPDKPVVVNKADGKLEEKLQQTQSPEETPTPYEAPERLDKEVDGLNDGYRIVFNAEVEISDQTTWPVYIVEPVAITQEQADAIRTALIGDKVLYKPGKYRSREEIQRSIDIYQEELKLSEGYPDLIDAYRKILKDLYAEYERTPADLKLEKADTKFKFMENRLRPESYGGKEITLDDGGMRYEWTDEARSKAIEAGCESIYGICWMDNGRKMEFSAANGDMFCGISFSAPGGKITNPVVTYSLEEAKAKGEALLDAMALDFMLVDAITLPKTEENDKGEFVENGMRYHTLTYKRNIEGTLQDNILSIIDQNISEPGPGVEFRSPVRSETITISFDDYGVNSFSWGTPMRVVSKETDNVALLPFEEVQSRIEQQLKAQTIWADDNEAEWIDERRIEIYKIKLSYLQVAKKDDLDSYYLIPVWNVCGDMYYHYKSDYPTGQSNTYVLDENFERNVWRYNDTKEYSIVTINAIDGSVVERYRGY